MVVSLVVNLFKSKGVVRLRCIDVAVVSMFACALLLAAKPSAAEETKNYLRIDRSLPNERDDLTVTSIGGLIFTDNTEINIDFSYVESEAKGNGLALGLGAGFVYNWDVSLYGGAGVIVGYNWTNEEYIYGVYPEIGVTADISEKFGVTVSAKRYFYMYGKHESMINIGVLFRN